MANILLPPEWRTIRSADQTSEKEYLNRRSFLQAMGITGLGLLSGITASSIACAASEPAGKLEAAVPSPPPGLYPAARAKEFLDGGRPMTPEEAAANYINFYEFSTDKSRVSELVKPFQTHPWEVKVDGLCENPGVYDLDAIEALGLEERVYRHRCVEAWAMTVPWTGVPLRRLIEKAQPTSKAAYVKFTSFYRPKEALGQARERQYTWPYYEALRMDEAMNELALLVTGIFGHRLPKQHGAPVRIISPWKYGYKSPKSIVRIEFVKSKPGTFWNDLQPSEYSFLSNVDPEVPHPRWSQASERILSTGDRVPTKLYNGYGKYVAGLY